MLVGINGFLGSGKDTVYQRIAALTEAGGFGIQARGSVRRISFADKLKLSAAAALGIFADDEVGGEEGAIEWMNFIKDEGSISVGYRGVSIVLTGRQYLQWYGTESHRDIFGDNFWVDQALPLDFDHAYKTVCVTDVRFDNEIARVKELGGQIWQVTGITDESAGTHASEKPIDQDLVDVHISNNIRDDNYAYLDDQIIRALGVRA